MKAKSPQPDLFGTDPYILYRHGAPETSVAAAHAVNTGKREREVLKAISYFPHGCISDEVREVFPGNTPYSSVTARYSALENKGLIRRGPDTRTGRSRKEQMVMRLTSLGREQLK